MDILKRIDEYAVNCGERTAFSSRTGEITYGELARCSVLLALYIDSVMGDNRDPVVVYGHKDPMMLVSFLACVRSGRAYCPMDLSMPADRIADVISQIGDPLVICADREASLANAQSSNITTDEDSDTLEPASKNYRCFDNANYGERLITYDDLNEITTGEVACVRKDSAEGNCDGDVRRSGAAELTPCVGEDNWYIIFTSGSTGSPKGVQITANNLSSYVDWAVTLAGGIEPGRTFLNQAPYSFDLSVMDLYLSLATGGTIISIDKEMQQDSGLLTEYIKGHRIDYWVSTPSFAKMCLGADGFDAAGIGDVRAFLFCGEVLPNSEALELIHRFPNSKIVNTYGPTESTVCVTDVVITEEMASSAEALPVGMPKTGSLITSDPETGEIIIMGDTVSPGYYRDPERTANAFYIDETTGLRAYRTGDKGHFARNGMLYCDGRIDNQIKLHGYRIELEDIEANLDRIEGVIQAAVVPRNVEGKAESITAFVVRDESRISDDYSGRKYIRTTLGAALPKYMVPKRVKFVDALPVTANGKLDRRKLEEMA